jgi:hypothetical protein
MGSEDDIVAVLERVDALDGCLVFEEIQIYTLPHDERLLIGPLGYLRYGQDGSKLEMAC